ncbi:MAG: DUF3795 domain-containing protein [bacterium]
MKKEFIAPCGIYCKTCVGYFGYTMSGERRKHICRGCRIDNKKCAFIKKYCEKIYQADIEFCFQCGDFPCIHLKKIDNRYREKYHMSLIENLEFIRDGLRRNDEQPNHPSFRRRPESVPEKAVTPIFWEDTHQLCVLSVYGFIVIMYKQTIVPNALDIIGFLQILLKSRD